MNKTYCCGILLILILLFLYSTNMFVNNNIRKSDYFFSFDEQFINGTTGTSLESFGCGGVKFDANTGKFFIIVTPPVDAYDFEYKAGALF